MVVPSTLTVLPTGEEVTVYRVIGFPPSEVGGDHVTVARPSPAAAVTSVGGDGVEAQHVLRHPGQGSLEPPQEMQLVTVAGPPQQEPQRFAS